MQPRNMDVIQGQSHLSLITSKGAENSVHEHSKPQYRDRASILSLLKSENDLCKVREMHAYILKQKMIPKDVYIATALLSKYAKCGALKECRQVFEQLLVRDVVSWTALIDGYAKHQLFEESLNCFRKMQEEGVSPDATTYTCILKACGALGSLDIGEVIDIEVRRRGLLMKHFKLGSALVDMYAKCGALEKARDVFEQLPARDNVSWTILLSGYVQHARYAEALNCFRQMQDEGVYPDATTYTCVLKACAATGSLEIGENIVTEVRKKGLLKHDTILGSALVDMYAKCGALQKAREVFDQLPMRNIAAWSALMAGYVKYSHGGEVLKCFREMKNQGVSGNATTYTSILKACGLVGSLDIGEDIHLEVRKQGLLRKNIGLGSSLIDMYFKCGALGKAHEVFEQLPVRDVVSCTAMISGYVYHGLNQEAINFFQQMQAEGVNPDAMTYTCILKACASIGSLEIGEDIVSNIRKKGLLINNIVLGSTIVDMYSKCGSLQKAQEVFQQLPVQDVVSWTALMTGYAQCGLIDEALNCFRQMQDEGVFPNAVTYICILKACTSLKIVEAIDEAVQMQGLLRKDVSLGNTLIDVYAKWGALEKAREVFEQIPVRDVVSWTTLMSAYANHGRGEETLNCFRQMQDEHVQPNKVTYICILKACGIVGSLMIGEAIDAEARREGLSDKDILLGNTLIAMYAKCGVIRKAREVFEQLAVRDVISWSALMEGYAQIGQANVVFTLLRKMRTEGIGPDLVTFLVLLTACSHAGLLNEGEQLFSEMCVVYSVTPTKEHYTCMIDLFGRMGQFDQAKGLLDKVAHSDYLPLLLAILGACQKWMNVDVGKWVFEQLLQLDVNYAAAYIGMENIYASS